MVRLSNGIISMLNLLTLLMGMAALIYSSWLYIKDESPCEHTLRMPLLVTGCALVAVSLAGLLGSCCRVTFFMWLYLIALFLLIVGVTIFTIFAVIVTNKGVGQALSGKDLGDRKLADYTSWLRNHVLDEENWDKLRSCLVQMKICKTIEGGKTEDYYKYNLSPLKSGCCKPPNYCELQFKNGTTWTMPEKGPAAPDPDCKKWSNDQTELCFNCESCKAAALASMKREWRTLGIVNACILLAVSIIYSVGCCALRNNQRYGYSKHRNYYYA